MQARVSSHYVPSPVLYTESASLPGPDTATWEPLRASEAASSHHARSNTTTPHALLPVHEHGAVDLPYAPGPAVPPQHRSRLVGSPQVPQGDPRIEPRCHH